MPPNDSLQLLEQIIIGGMIDEPKTLEYALSTLIADDFADERNKKIFIIMRDMNRDGKTVDVAEIIDPLMEANIPLKYSSECYDAYNENVLVSAQMPDRIDSLVQHSDKRFAYFELNSILSKVKSGQVKTANEVITEMETLKESIRTRHVSVSEEQIGTEAFNFFSRRIKAHQGMIPFGLKPVDNIIGGLGKGQLVIIAARPSVGKSALSLVPFVNCARAGHRSKLITLEMTCDEVYERLVQMMSGLSANAMYGRTPLSETNKIDLAKSVEELSLLPMSVDEGIQTTAEIESVLINAKSAGAPIRLLAIDYFGLMSGASGKRYAADNEQYKQISKDLKRLAIKYDLTILLLSQLNREVGMYEPPSMRHLRETGSLEQDADKIIFLWRDRDNDQITNLAVDKNRQGTTGETQLLFTGWNMRFSEVRN